MNRFVQKLIAGAAAVAIAVTGLLGGAPVAKAADPTTGTITISNASGDTATHTLDGWKLASLKNVASADGKLTFLIDTNNAMVPLIEASMTSDQLALYKADANYYTENGKENNPIGWLVANSFGGKTPETSDPWGGNSSALRTFATNLSKKLAVTGAPTATKTGFQSSATGFENSCDQGLWLLKDVSTDPTTQSIPIIVATKLADYSTETVNWGSVTLKMNVPTVDKKIAGSATGTVAADGSNADARIGDVVKYELSSVIPSYTGYEMTNPPRVFKLIDTASKGLTVDANSVKSVKLTKSGTTVTLSNNDYVVSSKPYDLTEGKTGYNAEYAGGTVTTIDLANYVNKAAGSTSSTDGILEGATVTVEFEATVNSSAVKAGVGNPNSVELEYSRTPDNVSTKISGPEVPRVYTYEFGILKTDMAGKAILEGAQFAIARVNTSDNTKTFLKRDAATGAWSELTATTPAKDGTESDGVFTTGADGTIKMSGLPEGTYYVEEIKAPTGYTNIGLPSFEFTISADLDTDGKTVVNLKYEKTTDTDGDRIAFDTKAPSQANIKNAKNLTELPMTGDLGIKVFVTVGVLLMAAGAAFALSARMRA
ncbi:isopeptide-forming domain-containing fimbrial protein [Collinsella aerofaciens]|uniref:isopeptide-forming domain-containing fimbrial protein n=1 Tax=Collinsella aerofaciens TaxID=74426 RepID=UPI00189B43CC|nr:isopeptide-forming domain-containing fimbrial protein [Collinsella aerofaciens]MDB1846649.1 SpaA isopeptide-forming pilin-related protein [Collinsella aerofaciens]MDB1848746.1 SpaA isopeptide-forming pilin-related protein [Collinsella aerofaciens]MDB1854001.1 SpaA isopeptide-forming pilin-related protein [Collinsella aerofaciens]